jgi:hypothetical protein
MKVYIFYAFLLLVCSLIACILLLPEAIHRITDPNLFLKPRNVILAVGSNFTLFVLSLGPLILFFKAVSKYHAARSLDRLGVITKGSVLQKWVDIVDDQRVYRASYQFKDNLQAWQTIPFQYYEEISPGQDIEVLCLEKFPHFSRLDWGDGC